MHKVYKNIPYAETTYAACLLVSPHNRACHFYWVHGCDKVTSLPSSSSFCIPSAGYLHVMGGGGYWVGSKEGVQCGRGRLCLCVRGRGVSGGGEGGCLFEDSARSLRLVSPAWLFEAVRWPHRATSPQVVVGWGDLLVLLLVVGRYGSLSFVYSCFFHLVQLPSSSPCSSVSSSTLSSCIPLLLLLCSISKTPSSSLKESCVGAGHTGRQPGEPKQVARSGNNRERHQYNGYH